MNAGYEIGHVSKSSIVDKMIEAHIDTICEIKGMFDTAHRTFNDSLYCKELYVTIVGFDVESYTFKLTRLLTNFKENNDKDSFKLAIHKLHKEGLESGKFIINYDDTGTYNSVHMIDGFKIAQYEYREILAIEVDAFIYKLNKILI